MRHVIWFLSAATVAIAAGCEATTSASRCAAFAASGSETVCITGTARYFAFEGGFWAIRGDDSTTYDPLSGLPSEFRREGLRVRLQARVRSDLGGYHMAGPIVEIVSIEAL